MNKLKLSIIITSILLIGITVTMLILFLPTSLPIDIDKVESLGPGRVEMKDNNGITELVLKDDAESFKVLVFTDTHLDTFRKCASYTLKHLVKTIQDEKPDFVIFDGDTITSSNNRKRTHDFCKLMEKLGVYWITVLGNHEGDNIRSISRSEFVKIYASYPHCLINGNKANTSSGEEVYGYGNTQINLVQKGKVIKSLFFLDSGDRVTDEEAKKYNIPKEDYDFIKESLIKWYQEQVSKLPEGVKSMIFIHIPLPEYKDAIGEVERDSNGNFICNKPNENGTYAKFGYALENVCSCNYNSGFFDVIKNDGHTQSVIAGHDHINYFLINYQGIDLIYAKKSGYGSYDTYSAKRSTEFNEGAMVMNIFADDTYTIEEISYYENFPEDRNEIKKYLK